MSEIDYDLHVKLKAGDKIYFILYYDHGTTQESIEKIRNNPLLLWSVGKIINEHTNDLFYIVLNTGSVGRYIEVKWKDIIIKSCILEKRVIYTIPKDFDKHE